MKEFNFGLHPATEGGGWQELKTPLIVATDGGTLVPALSGGDWAADTQASEYSGKAPEQRIILAKMSAIEKSWPHTGDKVTIQSNVEW